MCDDPRIALLLLSCCFPAIVVNSQLPAGKMAGISLKDFANEISPANEKAARQTLKEVRKR